MFRSPDTDIDMSKELIDDRQTSLRIGLFESYNRFGKVHLSMVDGLLCNLKPE